VRWVANYIKKHGTNGQWNGYHGPRDADPRWGESGYRPPSAPKSASIMGAEAAESSTVSPQFDPAPLDAYHRKVQAVKADLQDMHEMTVRPRVGSSRLEGLLGKTFRGDFTTAGVQGD